MLYDSLPRVHGLVVGMYGELSPDVKKVQDLVVERQAKLWAERTNLPAEKAIPRLKAQIKRRWALTALKSNAEVRLTAARQIMLGNVPDLFSPNLGPEGDALYHSATVGG